MEKRRKKLFKLFIVSLNFMNNILWCTLKNIHGTYYIEWEEMYKENFRLALEQNIIVIIFMVTIWVLFYGSPV